MGIAGYSSKISKLYTSLNAVSLLDVVFIFSGRVTTPCSIFNFVVVNILTTCLYFGADPDSRLVNSTNSEPLKLVVIVVVLGSNRPLSCVLLSTILLISKVTNLVGVFLGHFFGVRILGGIHAPVRSRVHGGRN